MVQIKPIAQPDSTCPYCEKPMIAAGVRWFGMPICYESLCPSCGAQVLEDLPVGHAVNFPQRVEVTKGKVLDVKGPLRRGQAHGKGWGESLLRSLQAPRNEEVEVTREVFKLRRQVIILNCIDNLYGHCLLKLLNAQRHLDQNSEYGLVVIVPKFLRWMVPQGVAEIWTVGIPLRNGLEYFPAFERFVQNECARFDEIYVSEAYSHPHEFNITRFTSVPKYDFDRENLKITFVWREDRFWVASFFWRASRRATGIAGPLLLLQNRKVRNLFGLLRAQLPEMQFAIAGLGTHTHFPTWIEDRRVEKYDEQTERKMCQLYAESFIVIGVHGSNLLLPSAQAGMTIDLMPNARWNNIAQDILYQEHDPRLAAFRYRYLPYSASVKQVTQIVISMYSAWPFFYHAMVESQL